MGRRLSTRSAPTATGRPSPAARVSAVATFAWPAAARAVQMIMAATSSAERAARAAATRAPPRATSVATGRAVASTRWSRAHPRRRSASIPAARSSIVARMLVVAGVCALFQEACAAPATLARNLRVAPGADAAVVVAGRQAASVAIGMVRSFLCRHFSSAPMRSARCASTGKGCSFSAVSSRAVAAISALAQAAPAASTRMATTSFAVQAPVAMGTCALSEPASAKVVRS